MSDIMINIERKYSATMISNVFIDKYLASANGEYVKVYLYLLRCISGRNTQFSISSAADFFDDTEGDITRALKYWEKAGVIRLDRDGKEIVGLTLVDIISDNNEVPSVPTVYVAQTPVPQSVISISNIKSDKPEVKANVTLSTPKFTVDEINSILGNPVGKEILYSIENYFERPLTEEDTNLIAFIYKDLGFSSDLLLYLYEKCIERNKKDPRYIMKVACDWHERNFTTVEEARAYVICYEDMYKVVNKAFSINRLPGDKEIKFIQSWQSMGFTPELVKEACDKALINCGKPNFDYTNKILLSWKEGNVTKISDIAAFETTRKANATPTVKKNYSSLSRSAEAYNSRYSQRDYSDEEMLDIERQLVAKTLSKVNNQ